MKGGMEAAEVVCHAGARSSFSATSLQDGVASLCWMYFDHVGLALSIEVIPDLRSRFQNPSSYACQCVLTARDPTATLSLCLNVQGCHAKLKEPRSLVVTEFDSPSYVYSSARTPSSVEVQKITSFISNQFTTTCSFT